MKAEKIRLIFRETDTYIPDATGCQDRKDAYSFHRFNQSVGGGHRFGELSRIFDCLMVEAVDFGLFPISRKHCIFQVRTRWQDHAGNAAGLWLKKGARTDPGKWCRRRKSQKLHSFADTEDRLSECFRRKVRKSSWNRSKS